MLETIGLFVSALALTIVIETGLAWLLGLRTKRALTTVLLINVVTNPLVNYLLAVNRYFELIKTEWALVLGLEIAVVIAEWLAQGIYPGIEQMKGLWLSAVSTARLF
jgi:hypothetical protein